MQVTDKTTQTRSWIFNPKWLDVLFVGLLAILAFLFLVKSPLHPWNLGESGPDSSVFKTVAMMMKRGYMPYKDTFDHKGPVIYLINLIGNHISSYRGVWVIEYCSLLSTMLFSFITLKTVFNTKRSFSLIAILTGFSLLFVYYEGGNLVEEYAMPFIAVSVYIFLDYLVTKRTSPIKLMVCGSSFGVVLLLRVNMVASWAVFCAYIMICLLWKRKVKELFVLSGWFLLGALIVAIPIVCWLGMNNALHDFWFDYVKFNFIYSAGGGGESFITKWNAFFYFINTTVFILSFVSSLFLAIKEKSSLWMVYSIGLVVNVVAICISGREYNHYGMILIPLVILPIGGILSFLTVQDEDQPIGAYLMAGFLLCSIVLGEWLALINENGVLYKSRNESHISDKMKSICNIIQSNSSADDAISVYGNKDIIYVLSDRKHATKYSFQFPGGDCYQPILEEYWEELGREQPTIIVVQQGYYDDDMTRFLGENHYGLLWAEHNDSLNDGDAVFVRH